MRPLTTVAALGLTQLIGYGTLYYSFTILAPAMAAEFGWPPEWIFAAFSAALMAGGLASPRVGRLIDRHGAGPVMAVGSGLAAAALVLCAQAPHGAVFAAMLVASGIAGSMVQYGAAFSALVQRDPVRAPRLIVGLTLIAGFGSTLFWPLTTALHGIFDWRQVYLLFALVHVVLCLPLHAALARPVVRRGKGPKVPAPELAAVPGRLPAVLRPLGFRLMAGAFALQSFVLSAVLVHMLPLLAAVGLGTAGVAVAALFGPAQVASRLINMLFGQGMNALHLALVSAALLPAGTGMLMLWPQLGGAVGFVLLFGMGSGLNSIATGTLPLLLFGSAGYGALQGRLSAVRLAVGAAAPFVLALLLERAGLGPTLATLTALGGGVVTAFLSIGRLLRRAEPG